MAIFGLYSKYYDLLYRDKDYLTEVDYIDKLIKKFGDKKVQRLLDIGCGTGIHAEHFIDKGYIVTGIDISKEMIEIANKKELKNSKFLVGNAVKFDLKEKFDTVLSLFHVIDYHIENHDLNSAIESVVKHLKPGGLFIFDFWYGPCVLSDLPKLKSKEFEDQEHQIMRLTIPDLYPNQNRVDVNYQITVLDKKTRKHETFKETHSVRYFFKPEIEMLLEKFGFEVLLFEEWLSGKEPGIDTFGVTVVGRLSK